MIVIDNRGVGRTSQPDSPYSIKMFVEDTRCILKSLGIEEAHILGISMGGFIAQQFTLDHPEMVLSLIIACSHFGGPNVIEADKQTQALMFAFPTETISFDQALEMRTSLVANKEFIDNNNALMDQIAIWREQYPQNLYAKLHQAQAATAFNAENQLHQVSVPTLIIHGKKDRIVPPNNAKMLAEKIKSSELVFIENGQHWIFVEHFEQFNEIILNFLTRIEND
ncbi:MAG: alpha/beta fold hydrolase [Candidatus Hodarchaeales archaeon]|jgi:pimeloyl-ACP methyl ester carboxylesterase